MAQVFYLQQLADKEVAIIHERVELSIVGAQLFDDPRPVHDLRVRQIGQELIDVAGAKSSIAFAKHDYVCVLAFQRLLKATIDALAVARLRFVVNDRACCYGVFECSILAVVAHDDYAFHRRVLAKVAHGDADAVLVVVGREHDCYLRVERLSRFVSFNPPRALSFPAEHEDQIDPAQEDAERGWNSAVPDDILVQLSVGRTKLKHQSQDRHQVPDQVQRETENDEHNAPQQERRGHGPLQRG